MDTVYFEIINGKRRKDKPCALLSVSPQNGFRIELSANATTENVPALFIPFIERGERVIDDKWARRWVQERIPPPGRQNLGEILNAHGLNEYDEVTLLRANQGKSSQDDFVVREIREDETDKMNDGRAQSKKHLGTFIRNRREALGLSQSDLASRTGIDQPALSRIESGQTNITFELLTDIFKAIDAEMPLFMPEKFEYLWDAKRLKLFNEIKAFSNDLAHTYKRLVELIENYSPSSDSRAIDAALIGHCLRELVNSFPEYVDKTKLLMSDQGREFSARDKLLNAIAALDDIHPDSTLQYTPIPTTALISLKEYASTCQNGASFAEERISAAAYGDSDRRGIAMEPWERAGKIGVRNAHLKRIENPALPGRSEYEKALSDLEHAIKARLDPIFETKERILEGLARANRTSVSGHFEQPDKETVRGIAELVNSDKALEFLFFDQLQNPLWLTAFDEIGYFDSYLLSMDKNADSAHFTPLRYLQRCAPDQPKSTLSLLKKLGSSKSDVVRTAVIRIAYELPDEQFEAMVQIIATWPMFALDAKTPIYDSRSLATLITKAFNSNNKDAQQSGLAIFQSAARLFPDIYNEFYRDIETRIDRYEYFDFVLSTTSHLETPRRFGLCKRNLISYIEAKGADASSSEASCIFIPSLAHGDLQSAGENGSHCSPWAIGMLDAVTEQLQSESSKLLSSIIEDQPIIKRVILQAFHEWINRADRPASSNDYVLGLLKSIFEGNLLFDRCYEFEILPLLGDFAKMSAKEDILAFFEHVDHGLRNKLATEYRKLIEIDGEKQPAYKHALRRMESLQQGILSQFDIDQLPAYRYRDLCMLNRKRGTFDGPRKLVVTTSLSGPNSPIDDRAFLKMGAGHVLRFLERWQPAQEDIHNLIDRDGVSNTLSHVLEQEPFFFDEYMEQIAHLDPVYLKGMLSGWQKAIEKSGVIPTHDVVLLCHTLAMQVQEREKDADSVEEFHNSRGLLRQIGWLLQAILNNETLPLNSVDMNLILDSLEVLLWAGSNENEQRSQDQTADGDLLTATLNLLRPIAISGLAVWLYNNGDRTEDSTAKAFALLAKALPTASDFPIDVVALYEQLPHLLDSGYAWVDENYENIFGGRTPTDLQKLALSSILTLYRPSPRLLHFLRPAIDTALESGAENYPLCTRSFSAHDCLENIGTWLYEGYVIGVIELQDPLLIKWESKAAKMQASILNGICAKLNRSENAPETVIKRVQLLWEHCNQHADSNAQKPKGAAHLLKTEYYEDDWVKDALLVEARSHDLLDALFLAQEPLESLAKEDPVWGLSLLRALLENAHSSKYYHYEKIAFPLLRAFLTKRGSKDNPDFTYCLDRLGKLGMIDLDEKLNIV